MNRDNNIREELKAMDSPLADMSRTMPYVFPNGYFEQLPQLVAENNKTNISPEIAVYQMPYTIPEGYFDNLPAQLLQTARAGGQTHKEIPVCFVSFPKMKLAMAAMLALVISFGGFMMFTENRHANPENVLASIPGNEINEYLQHNGLDADAINSNIDISNLNVDNKDIVAYLNETGWE